MERGKIFFHSFAVILILSLLHGVVEGGGEDSLSKIGIQPIKNRKAPNFLLKSLNGKNIELKHFKGKVVFLNFWATWCGPCKEEMPSMEALFQQFKEKDFVLLAISVDYEGRKPVKEFIDQHKYGFPVLLDPQGETLDLYDVKGIPTTIIIDKKGAMIGKAVGLRDWRKPEMISFVHMLLGKR